MYLRRKLMVMAISAAFCSTASQASETENSLPYLPGLPDQANMIAPHKTAAPKSKTYILPATPATSQWGVFDNAQPPVLTINSGDTVVIETMAAADNQVVPGTTIDQVIYLNTAVEGRGPHTVTGPIYVQGAEPGDTLRIHINKIVPRAYASNDTTPGKGLFPEEFGNKHPYVKYYYLDVKNMKMQFSPGVVVPLAPFPGVVAVARTEPGKYSSGPPGTFGGNMDLRVLTEGSTLYLPVFVKGGLVWSGDSHAGQGNGEIDLTAIETAFQEFNVTIDVIKHQPLDWPRAETKTDWVAVGYDADLNKAFDILKSETIKLITEKRKVSSAQAAKIMYDTWNCPIAEVVNGVQGVYCMVPKQGAGRPTLLKADNDQYFVTYGKDADLEKAMKAASMAMIDKVSTTKKMSRDDVYTLASFTMDCRIAPHKSGDKEVHCLMAKNLWTQ
jgi:acetamidase/formamidase